MKKIFLFTVLLFSIVTFAYAQKSQKSASVYDVNKVSMFRVLWDDYRLNKEGRKQKRECYARYTNLFFKTVYAQITAPAAYVAYYRNRKEITSKLEEFYKENNLDNIENIGKDIVSGAVDKQCLRDYLGETYYKLWLYGDTSDPVNSGGVPDDYKADLPMFWRRWFFCAVRNPRWNATYINNYSEKIIGVMTSYDTRQNINTRNYGTSDTKLGTWLRWYVDEEGKWWFFYENTRRTKPGKGKLFYFGAVGLGGKDDGFYKTDGKQGRFEFSLNRTVTIEE